MALTEGIHNGEFLLSEGNGSFSREKVTLAITASAIVSGTVMGKVTATGHYKPYSNGASDGTEAAAGILLRGVGANAATQPGVLIVRQAEVASARLTGSDANGVADLLALGIIVRT
jgi:hypothetical protein